MGKKYTLSVSILWLSLFRTYLIALFSICREMEGSDTNSLIKMKKFKVFNVKTVQMVLSVRPT